MTSIKCARMVGQRSPPVIPAPCIFQRKFEAYTIEHEKVYRRVNQFRANLEGEIMVRAEEVRVQLLASSSNTSPCAFSPALHTKQMDLRDKSSLQHIV